MSRLAAIVAVALFCGAASAQAQTWEAAGLAGMTPAVTLDRQAPELDGLSIAGGFTWGVQVARFFSPHFGAEVAWTEQQSALEVETAGGTADLFTLTVRQLHGNAVYRFGAEDARVQPFVFGGLGATFFGADDVPSETKLSLGFGGGVKYFLWSSVGVKGQLRYKPTFLNDESAGDFCDPFGFCQNTLRQVEFMAGVVMRF
jgi:hypothetical protein